MSKKTISDNKNHKKNISTLNSKNNSLNNEELKKKKGIAFANICALLSIIILILLIKYAG